MIASRANCFLKCSRLCFHRYGKNDYGEGKGYSLICTVLKISIFGGKLQ